MNLSNQTAIVTGGNSGIGHAVAIALGQAGANVIVAYIADDNAAAETVAHCGNKSRLFHCDVSDENSVMDLFDFAREELGTVDILVNNAGIQCDSAFADMTLQKWQRVINVNLTGQFLCARESVKEFKRRGAVPYSRALGKIICMSSVHEIIPWGGHVNYAASKGGIAMMMRSIAQEVAADHIRVNAICPGAIKTPINRAAWDSPEQLEKLLRLIPQKRIGEPEDIGRAAVWLASDDSDYVHGTSLYVDGGMLLYPGFEGNG